MLPGVGKQCFLELEGLLTEIFNIFESGNVYKTLQQFYYRK